MPRVSPTFENPFMRLAQMICTDFRSLEHVDFQPGPGVTVIRGGNAQGKTSLLEAVLYAATSKSHRTSQESDLPRHGAEGFSLRARVARQDREVAIEAHWWHGQKRFKVNGVPQTRISDILGKVHVVFFSPEDVALVRGAASVRRRFLDMELSQLSPAYLHALQRYRQILRQRNELLRRGASDPTLLEVWDEQLAAEGESVMQERCAFIEELCQNATNAHAQIADGEQLSVLYEPDIRAGVSFRDILAAARKSDLKQGMTTRGPHRDDIEFTIGGQSARAFASQGQQRTAALAVKLAEVELVRGRAGEYPILMLDDVLSELDAQRSRHLFGAIGPHVQCLVTTTDLTGQNGLFGPDAAYVRIEGGCIEEA